MTLVIPGGALANLALKKGEWGLYLLTYALLILAVCLVRTFAACADTHWVSQVVFLVLAAILVPESLSPTHGVASAASPPVTAGTYVVSSEAWPWRVTPEYN